MTLLKESLPSFYKEIEGALNSLNLQNVISQLPNLTIERFTLDEKVHAMYIYVAGVRKLNKVESSIIGVKHKDNIVLELPGMVVVDLDNFDRVMGIEVLDRPDIETQIKLST